MANVLSFQGDLPRLVDPIPTTPQPRAQRSADGFRYFSEPQI